MGESRSMVEQLFDQGTRLRMSRDRLFRSRRDFDPRLWARRRGRVVGLGAWAVVPVRLRMVVSDHGCRLHDDRRRRVVRRRVVPPRTPPERRTNHDGAVPTKSTVESRVPVKRGGPVKSGRPDESGMPMKSGCPAKAGAAATGCGARRS